MRKATNAIVSALVVCHAAVVQNNDQLHSALQRLNCAPIDALTTSFTSADEAISTLYVHWTVAERVLAFAADNTVYTIEVWHVC